MNNNYPPALRIDNISLPAHLRGGVVVIGNFDGIHRGHQAVIEKACAIAAKLDAPTVLLTFDPHPRTWFNPKEPVYILMPSDQKAEFAAKLGCAGVAVHSFNGTFAALSADEFIDEILIAKMAPAHIVIGHDFHFGAKRAGTPQYLVERGQSAGFGVTLVDACGDENGEIISSSKIRAHLENGELALANGLLGYAYQIRGEVIHGQKKGRELGFPTANIALPSHVKLRHGIYATRVIRADGSAYDGVSSFGRRPTFDNGEALFETYLFDFDEDLYGEELTVILYSWLRAEMKFDKVDDLIAQMNIDKNDAAQFLSALPPDHLRWPVGAGADA